MVQPEGTLPTPKDLLATQEITHASNADNKDISLATALRGSDETIITPISSILTTMTKSTTITTPRNNRSTLLTTSRLDLLTFQEMIKPN